MRIRKSERRGARAEVLAKLNGRCERLEEAVCAFGFERRLQQAFARIAALEEEAQHTKKAS